MLESKLKDIRKYIWVEEICHDWAVIDWDTFSKISKNRTILDFFSESKQQTEEKAAYFDSCITKSCFEQDW